MEFKHWIVYVVSLCPIHGLQHWCVEKISKPFTSLAEGPQVVKNRSIFMSCSRYPDHLHVGEYKYIKNNEYYLDQVYNHIVSLSKSGYNPILNNCIHFKEKFWKWVSQMS